MSDPRKTFAAILELARSGGMPENHACSILEDIAGAWVPAAMSVNNNFSKVFGSGIPLYTSDGHKMAVVTMLESAAVMLRAAMEMDAQPYAAPTEVTNPSQGGSPEQTETQGASNEQQEAH